MAMPRSRLPVVGGEELERIRVEKPEPHERPAPPQKKRAITLVMSRIAKGLGPLVLLAVSAPSGGCYCSHMRPPDGGTEMDAGTDAGFDAAIPPRPDIGPYDAGVCEWAWEERFTVEVPPPGTPADATLICVEPSEVTSNEAARVTMVLDPADASLAHATITIAPDLAGTIIGVPEVTATSDSGWGPWVDVTFLPVSAMGADFVFDVQWPAELRGLVDMYEGRGEIHVRFDLDCGGGEMRRVVSTTIVHLCVTGEGEPMTIASSGQECRTCAIIAEMAPTPIIPAERPDALPLQQGIHLALRPIARFENALVLLAEHDGGDEETSYEWHATAGTMQRVEEDIVLWEPAPTDEPQAVQVCVQTPRSAGVATFRRGAGL